MIGKVLAALVAGAVGFAIGGAKKTKQAPAKSTMWVLSGTNNGWMNTEKVNQAIIDAKGKPLNVHFFMRRELDPIGTIRIVVYANVIGSGKLPDGRRYFDVKITEAFTAMDNNEYPVITDWPAAGSIARVTDNDIVGMGAKL